MAGSACRSIQVAESAELELDIHERDIAPELCQECAACCRVRATVKDTDSRFRVFLRTTLREVMIAPAAELGQADCCDERHDITLDHGFCKHLESSTVEDRARHSCGLYGRAEMPSLCCQYNCVSWAKHEGAYHLENKLLVTAQQALNRMRLRDARLRDEVNMPKGRRAYEHRCCQRRRGSR